MSDFEKQDHATNQNLLVQQQKSATCSWRSSRRLFLANGITAAGSLFIGTSSLANTFKESQRSALQSLIKGRVITVDDPNFMGVVYGEAWNKLIPKRAPQIVVRVANEQDVVEAVKFAKANKLKVAVRGGGHNWCNPSIRNGGMMIDLSELNQVISIDKAARRAVVQPIISNREMQAALKPHDLAYPTGHCPPVKLSGYLLSGGMAWNQGVWGPGIGSVEALELVTPDGELITATKDQNSDYFWAARGAGPGLFAVAVRYHLKLYPLPKAMTNTSYVYPLDQVGAVAKWLGKTSSKLTPNVELSLFMLTASPDLVEHAKKDGGKVCMVTATVFADSDEEAANAIIPLSDCPVSDKCLKKTIGQKVDFETLFNMSGSLWPGNLRCNVEAMFSNSKSAEVFESLRAHFMSASPATLIMFAIFTGPNIPAPLPDAAFSMSAHLYGGPWTMWQSEKDDIANSKWHSGCLALLKPFVAGHYVGESDTVTYPEHAVHAYSKTNWERLAELRSKYDPNGVFFAFSDGLN